jgi:CheY-like chemotaxis protein
VAALGVFADASVAVDLVLTDVMMPAMGGVELVRALRARRPRLAIVATTGMAEDDKRSALTELGVNAIVDKPASPQAMLRAVHAALNPAPVTR